MFPYWNLVRSVANKATSRGLMSCSVASDIRLGEVINQGTSLLFWYLDHEIAKRLCVCLLAAYALMSFCVDIDMEKVL